MVLVGRCMGIVYVPGWEVYNSVYVPGWEVYGALYGNGWEVYGAVYRPDWEVIGLSMSLAGRCMGLYMILVGRCMGLSMFLAERCMRFYMVGRCMALIMAYVWSWHGGTWYCPWPGWDTHPVLAGKSMIMYMAMTCMCMGLYMIIDRNMYLTYMSFILFKQIVYVHILKIIRIHTQQM